MKIADILGLPADQLVLRLWRRLIPLASGARYADLPLPARHVFVVVEWLGEVHNGGVRQYFSNSSGDRWADARFAFSVVGAGGDTFAKALTAFPGGAPPSHPVARSRAVLDAKRGGALDAIDALVDADRGAVTDAVAAYVNVERAAFAFVDRYPSGVKALDVPDDAAAFGEFVKGADVDNLDDAFTVVTWAAFLWRPLTAPTKEQQAFLDAFDVLDEASADGVSGYKKTLSGQRADAAAKALDDMGAGGLAKAVRDDDDGAVQGLRTTTAQALARYVKRM